MSSANNPSVSLSQSESVDGHRWSGDDLLRLQTLDIEIFMSAMNKLAAAAHEGSDEAAASYLNGARVASLDAWLHCNELTFVNRFHLSDCFMPVMERNFDAAYQTLMPILEGHLRNGNQAGQWSNVERVGRYGGKTPAVFSPDGIISDFIVHSIHACKDEDRLGDMLDRIGPWHDWLKTKIKIPRFVGAPAWKDAGSKVEIEGNLVAHAMIANNPHALRAIKNWDPAGYAKAMESDVAKPQINAYANNGISLSALLIGAQFGSCDALAQAMLDAQEMLSDERRFFLIGNAMLHHIEDSGLNAQLNERKNHDLQLSVCRTLLKGGGKDLISQFPRWFDIETAHMQEKNYYEPRPANTGSLFSLCREIANKAINRVHPEMIEACAVVLEDSTSRRSLSKSLSMLKTPYLSAIGQMSRHGDVDASVLDRICRAFDSDFIKDEVARYGGEFVRDAAKRGNFDVAAYLVGNGADPEEKDDNGWRAASYFKGEKKSRWNSFVAAHKAKEKMSHIMKISLGAAPRAQ